MKLNKNIEQKNILNKLQLKFKKITKVNYVKNVKFSIKGNENKFVNECPFKNAK